MPKIRHILIAVDGSEASTQAARKAVAFAHSIGARVTAIHVIPKFHEFTFRAQALLSYRSVLARDTRTEYNATTARCARAILHAVEADAAARGVRCDALFLRGDQPYAAIISAARRRKCDLISMGSHGWGGVEGVLLGSESHKVLVHSPLPVLVWR